MSSRWSRVLALGLASVLAACATEEVDPPLIVLDGAGGAVAVPTAGTGSGAAAGQGGALGEGGAEGGEADAGLGAGGTADAGPQVIAMGSCSLAEIEQLQLEPGFTELLPDRHYEFCSPGMWCWSNPLPQGSAMRAVWGSASDDIWAVGEAGAMLHWDGLVWASVNSNTVANLNDVWGTGPDDVWAVGLEQDYPAYSGVVIHWDGTSWSTAIAGTAGYLSGVWGSSAEDVWAVGTNFAAGAPFVLHWDGVSWQESPLDTSPSGIGTAVG
jgi:hypothetical protein